MAIHPTAIVNSKADIDPTVEVGAYCVIDAHVRVGPGCRLYHGVYLTGWTDIGEGCVIHPGAVIGHEPQDVKYKGERTFCRIGRETIIREYVTIHRGTIPESETRIGERCFLLAGSHVAHNCTVGNQVTLINGVLLAGHVEVGDRVTMGGAVGVHQFSRIGELTMIAGNGIVTMDIIPYALVNRDGRISGINRVGLRRAGLAREEIQEIRQAYRVLFNSHRRFADAVEHAIQTMQTPAGRRIVEFLQASSRRGYAGRTRGRVLMGEGDSKGSRDAERSDAKRE